MPIATSLRVGEKESLACCEPTRPRMIFLEIWKVSEMARCLFFLFRPHSSGQGESMALSTFRGNGKNPLSKMSKSVDQPESLENRPIALQVIV